MTRLALSPLLLLACSSPSTAVPPPPTPCPTVAEAPLLDAGPEAQAPTTLEWDVDTSGLTIQVESAVLRALDAWQVRTIGRVRFHVLEGAATTCQGAPTIRVFDTDDALPEEGGYVGAFLPAPEGTSCASVSIRASWSSSPTYENMFARTGQDPFVAIAAHELGHVLGLGHTAVTERSVMVPEAGLIRVTGPTCLDVTSLSMVLGSPMGCEEGVTDGGM